MQIRDIRTDRAAIEIIDELKYRLKMRGENTPICDALNSALNKIIEDFSLGWSQHDFARAPTDSEE